MGNGNPVGSKATREELYRQKWQALVKSPLYLVFVISCVCAILMGIAAAIVMFANAGWNMTNIVSEGWGIIGLPVGIGVVVVLLGLMTLCAWLVRAKADAEGKARANGVSVLFWTFLVLLVVIIFAFAATLPVFTEHLKDTPTYLPLEIIYCIYIFVGLDCAFNMLVMGKMKDNLTFFEGTAGPVIPLVVMNILRAVIAIALTCYLAFTNVVGAIAAAVFAIPAIAMAILLFKYKKIVYKLDQQNK